MSKLEETLRSVTDFFKTDTAFTKTPDLNKLAEHQEKHLVGENVPVFSKIEKSG